MVNVVYMLFGFIVLIVSLPVCIISLLFDEGEDPEEEYLEPHPLHRSERE